MYFYEVEKVGHPTHFFSNIPLKKHATSGPRARDPRVHLDPPLRGLWMKVKLV